MSRANPSPALPSEPGPPARTRWRSLLGFAIGLALLAGAVYVASSQAGTLRSAADSVRHAPPWLIGLCLLLPLVNWLLTSAQFWVLMNRHAPVPARDMAALIASSWLLNMLPMRPGLVGRVAYHRAVHGVSVRDSLRVLIEGMACGVLSSGLVLGGVAIAGAIDAERARAAPAWAWGLALSAPVLLGALGGLALRARGGQGWRLGAALAFRGLDLAVWAARYWVVFRLVGRPIEPGHAAAIAGVSQLAFLVPIAGNGLGVREWLVGLTAGALPLGGAVTGAARVSAGFGLSADLVNRAAEILVSVPLGLAATAWLSRRTAWRVAVTAIRGQGAGGGKPGPHPADLD